jgi:hypothetical protein
MVYVGQNATLQEVQARWAYGEFVSPRFKSAYATLGNEALRKKAKVGIPYEELRASETRV